MVKQVWLSEADGLTFDTEAEAAQHEKTRGRRRFVERMYARSPDQAAEFIVKDWSLLKTVMDGTLDEARSVVAKYCGDEDENEE